MDGGTGGAPPVAPDASADAKGARSWQHIRQRLTAVAEAGRAARIAAHAARVAAHTATSADAKAAAEAEFLESLDALLHIAADASVAQCVALMEAVTGGLEGSACSVDRPFSRSFTLFTRRGEMASDVEMLQLLQALMRKHASDARVQAACLDFLVHIAFVHPPALGEEGTEVAATVNAISAAACAHTGHLVAHYYACQAIVAVSQASGYLPCSLDRAPALAVCDAVCAAREIHAASAELQQVSLQALGIVCLHAGMHDGAMRAALATMRAPGENNFPAACLTLTGLAEGCDKYDDGEGLLALCEASAAVVIAAMRRCLHLNATVQGRASMTLAKMSVTPETAALICSLSGIEAVVDALQVHNTLTRTSRWEVVEKSAWFALLVMTGFDDAQSQVAIDAGALSLPPASSEEAIGEREAVFKRLRSLQRRNADAAVAKQREVYKAFFRREAEAEAAEQQREADAAAAEAAKQQAAAVAAAAADHEASMQRAALAADAAMEALLAEEEAERAAAGTKPSGKPKRKPKATRAAPAPAPEPVPAAASADAVGEGGAAEAGTAQPSASAARRRRRAAAKAAAREHGVSGAAAASAPSALPLAAEVAASHTDASPNSAAQSASDDDAWEDANAELPDALQSVHVTPPADAAHVAKLLAESEERACTICLDAPRCVALFPCRHLALCGAPECAAMLGAPPMCPLCRKPVAEMFQLFM